MAEMPTETASFELAWKSAVQEDWMVEMVWFELAAPHTVLSNSVSIPTRLLGESRYAHGNHAVAA